jgi:hypothetical protein
MKYLLIIALTFMVFFLTGCPRTGTPMPGPIRDKLIERETGKLTALADAYDNAVLAGDAANLGKAQLYRNELVHIGLVLIDDNYNQFENNLFVGRAKTNVAGDITELGVAAATGITNGERVKTILAVALTAFKGGRKSIDMNFFRERTTEVIAQKMRGSRSKVLQGIYQGLALPVDRYPLGAALDDLIIYLYAGSLNSAMLELAQDAGEDAKKAKSRAATLKLSPFVTEAEAVDFNKIRQAATAIKVKLLGKQTEAQGRTELESVLKQLYTGAELGDLSKKSSEDMFELLQDKIDLSVANNDEALRKQIIKALGIVQ